MPLVDKLRAWLDRPRALAWIALLALILTAPALAVGWTLDDHIHRLMLAGAPSLQRAPHDLYAFIPDDPVWVAERREAGAIPWYASTDLKVAFWRPLASLALQLDHLVAPGSSIVAHLHSLLWYAALALVLAGLYRRLLQPRWLALLAMLVFVIDDAHGPTVGWVANRHALISMTLASAALLLHVHWRQQRRQASAILAPLVLAASLLAGELALSITAYFFAYALFAEQGPIARRLASLAPAGVVCALWRVAYTSLGYGVQGSSLYLDPISHPGQFLLATAQRWPLLVQAQLTPLPSDFSIIVPAELHAVVAGAAAALVGAMIYGAWPLLCSNRIARFWTVGMLLSALPACAVFPMDRLLLPLGIGAAGLVAGVLGWTYTAASAGTPRALPGRGARVLATVWVATHLVLAPLLLPLRTYSVRSLGAPYEGAARSLERAGEPGRRTLVFVTGPDFFYTAWLPATRESLGLPAPEQIRVLGTTNHQVEVLRAGPRELSLRASRGFLSSPMDWVVRSQAHPFTPGDRVNLGDSSVEIVSLTPDGRPAELLCTFERDLDDESLVWVAWTASGYQKFSVPKVGTSRNLAGHTLMDLVEFRYP